MKTLKINKFKMAGVAVLMFFCSPGIFAAQKFTVYSDAEQHQIKQRLLDNIASSDRVFVKSIEGGVIRSMPGAVLASPSNGGENFSQDYQFHWTRDAAISMQPILSDYRQASSNEKQNLNQYLLNYLSFERSAQQQKSRPGEQTLGQPKFNIDASVWEGEWGRPQNDGPALRAITMIDIARQYLLEGKRQWVLENIIPMIKIDLDYIVKEWRTKNYGLWEEVFDQDHYFNKVTQRKALNMGSVLFNTFADHVLSDKYLTASQEIENSLSHHWNSDRGYYTETVNQQDYKGGGLNASVLLASLYGEMVSAKADYSVHDERVMSTVYHLRKAFTTLYPVNLQDKRHAPLVGRYPSDIYDGNHFIYGNPWVLISHAMAEYYYRLAGYYTQTGLVSVTMDNILFFKQIDPLLVKTVGSIEASSKPAQFNFIVSSLIAEGDRYLASVKRFASRGEENGELHFAEQIDKHSGQPVSAKDLTWGYMTLLSAIEWRCSMIRHASEGWHPGK